MSDFRRLVVNGIYWCLNSEAPRRYPPGWRAKTGQPWRDMDYGPYLSTAVAANANNLTYKGIVIPLTPDLAGGAVVFDTDLLRYAGGWIDGLIDFADVAYNGWHQSFPSIEGKLLWENRVGPGWAKDGSFEDARAVPFGPLPKDWVHWKGLYLHGNQVVLSYTVGARSVLETPSLESEEKGLAFARTFHLGPSTSSALVRIATIRDAEASDLHEFPRGTGVALYPPGAAPGAHGSLLAALIDAPEGTQWEIVKDELRVRFPASKQAISAKVLITPAIQDTLELDMWTQFVETSPPVVDLTKLIRGGPQRWSEKLFTTGDIDIQQQLKVETLKVNAETSTWHLEKDGYLPAVLSIENLSPVLDGVGSAAQSIAVLRPPTETTHSASADEQKHDATLIGH